MEYYRDALTAIRESIGDDCEWLGCIAPFLPSLGFVDMILQPYPPIAGRAPTRYNEKNGIQGGLTDMASDHMVCPWRAGPLLTGSIRKLFHDPFRILTPRLSAGMTAMDVGCGMGYFTLPLSAIVGEQGRVIAVDLQAEMLKGLKRNAAKAGAGNIMLHQCAPHTLRAEPWNGRVDFALIFWMLHEVPDQERLIREVWAALSDRGGLLFVEPFVHVGRAAFENSLDMITRCGFTLAERPQIVFSRAALLRK